MTIRHAPASLLTVYRGLLRKSIQELKAVNQTVEVRPNGFDKLLSFARSPQGTPTTYRYRLEPLVLRVVERPNKTVPDLYIVIKGDIDLDLSEASPRLVWFVTQVAYFKRSPHRQRLEGVFGAHYDFEPDANNHPVFHAQLTDCAELRPVLDEQFRLTMDSFENHTTGMLRQVRLPSAQLDYFAVLVQIAADHLLRHDAGSEEQDAFERLGSSCESVPSASEGLTRYDCSDAAYCIRGPHWYPPDG